MIRARILVEGVVQRVGYRDFVQELARELGVKGYVENLKDGSVCIVCEGEREVADGFVKDIKVKKDFIDVKDVRAVETGPATGEFEYFELKYGPLEEEFGERMGEAVKIAHATRHNIQEMHRGLKSSVADMHKDMSSSFNVMAERYDSISSELIRTREELKRAVNGLLRFIQKLVEEKGA